MEIKLPKLSDLDDAITITLWHVDEDAAVNEGDDLLEVSTDKATFDVPSPATGILKKIEKNPGDTVRPGETIGEIA